MQFTSRMFQRAKQLWHEFRSRPPGVRFRGTHREYARHCRGWVKVLLLVAAVISFAIGVVLAFIPGPAVVFFAITCAICALLSGAVARLFDRTELKLRRLIRRYRARRAARRAPHVPEPHSNGHSRA